MLLLIRLSLHKTLSMNIPRRRNLNSEFLRSENPIDLKNLLYAVRLQNSGTGMFSHRPTNKNVRKEEEQAGGRKHYLLMN